MSSLITVENRWEDVEVESELASGQWTKNATSVQVLKQLTLSLIHGKYRGRPIIYTDASSDFETCGIGIYHEQNNVKMSLTLQYFVCIMSAELEAICVALQYITRNGIQDAVIMTDSKAGCIFLQNYIRADEKDDVVEGILKMAAQSKTTIQWIPGHARTHGNEMADKLAKAALNQQLNPGNVCNNRVFLHDAINYFRNLSDEMAQQCYLEYSAILGKG